MFWILQHIFCKFTANSPHEHNVLRGKLFWLRWCSASRQPGTKYWGPERLLRLGACPVYTFGKDNKYNQESFWITSFNIWWHEVEVNSCHTQDTGVQNTQHDSETRAWRHSQEVDLEDPAIQQHPQCPICLEVGCWVLIQSNSSGRVMQSKTGLCRGWSPPEDAAWNRRKVLTAAETWAIHGTQGKHVAMSSTRPATQNCQVLFLRRKSDQKSRYIIWTLLLLFIFPAFLFFFE